MKVWVAMQAEKPVAVFACKELYEAFALGVDTGRREGTVTVTHMDITGFRPLKMLLPDDEEAACRHAATN